MKIFIKKVKMDSIYWYITIALHADKCWNGWRFRDYSSAKYRLRYLKDNWSENHNYHNNDQPPINWNVFWHPIIEKIRSGEWK